MTTHTIDCKAFQDLLPELVLTPGAVPGPEVVAHLRTCPPCAGEYTSFQATFALLDTWKAVEPTPYFDTRLQARVREAQAEPALGWLQRLQSRILFNTGRSFRPALAGAMALVLTLGGGSLVGLHYHRQVQPEASATVQDLQILDRNEQAFQQMDELQQQDDDTPQSDDTIQQNPTS